MKAVDALRQHDANHHREDDRVIRFLIDRFGDDEKAIRKLPADESEPVAAIDNRARLRREVAGKRELLGVAQRLLVLRDLPMEESVRVSARDILQTMAVVYDDHPGYDESWRPRGKRRRGAAAAPDGEA